MPSIQPTVGFEESQSSDTLILDATNLAPLYGGEEKFVKQVARGMRQHRLEARLALADTIGAAWARAHHGGEGDADCGSSQEIAELPLAALRLPEELLATLDSLGLATLGQVLELPRDDLRSRFGPQLLLRIDQLLGSLPETLVAVPYAEEFVVERLLEYPLADRLMLDRIVGELAQQLAWMLGVRCRGALVVQCRFECEEARSVEIEIRLFQPSAHAVHLWELLQLRLERVWLPNPATAVSLRVASHGAVAERQGALFDEEGSLAGSRQLAALVDRLAGRLGGESVLGCRPTSDAQPELAYRLKPLVGAGARGAPRSRSPALQRAAPDRSASRVFGPLERPVRLLTRPAPIETLSVAPDGPPGSSSTRAIVSTSSASGGPSESKPAGGVAAPPPAITTGSRSATAGGIGCFAPCDRGEWFLHGTFD